MPHKILTLVIQVVPTSAKMYGKLVWSVKVDAHDAGFCVLAPTEDEALAIAAEETRTRAIGGDD